MSTASTNPWVLHTYTQDEKDKIHDIYIKLKHIEDKVKELSDMRQDIRDELIPDIMDGDIMMNLVPYDIIQQIDFVEGEMQHLINVLHDAQIG